MCLSFSHLAANFCALVGAVLMLAAPAQGSAYVAGGIGLYKPSTNNVTIGPASIETSFETGFVALGAFGRAWEQGFRTELELGYRDSGISTIAGTDANGSQDIFSTMGNIVFDINISEGLAVHLGGGIGLAWTEWSDVSTAISPTFNGTKSNFAYQGIIGASYPLSDGLDLTFEYRYLNQTDLDYPSVPAGNKAMDHDNRNHNVIIGLRFAFWGSDKQPRIPTTPVAQQPDPVPVPVLAPPPPLAFEEPRTFVVLFDWDKATLDTEAKSIVREASTFAQRETATRIRVIGHTDRSGANAYNMALSERRARSVKSELVRLGLPESDIAVLWRGELENRIRTDDGIREPQNRRVEIIID